MNNDWEIVIGIEIHIELNTKTKMFSPVQNEYGDEANTNVSNIDLAYPGSLPLLNSSAIIKAIKLAKALEMEIDPLVRFDRKNYFYPDLTKGYQITQQFHPIGKNGLIRAKVQNSWKTFSIERIHMEEDTAKSIHENGLTYLNYNRCGVPLIEIVSNPAMHSAEDAMAYVEAIRQTALVLDISDAKLNEGSLRTDVNLSVRRKGENVLNTRTEIKNLNSLSNIKKAIEYESNFQIQMYENNLTFNQETKRFDEKMQKTVSMRSKGDAISYKYFPDPNLPYIQLQQKFIDDIKIEEIPYQKELRYLKNGLNQVQISQLLNNISYAKYIDSINSKDFKKATNVFFSDIVTYLNSNNKNIENLSFKADDARKVVEYLIDNRINKNNIAEIIKIKDQNPNLNIESIIKDNGFLIEIKEIDLNELVQEILNENPNLETEFKNNYNRAQKFMQGQIMKKTMGKANLKNLDEIIKNRFNNE
ncbi:Asp-tRNA(Asn)/Glu-tRNA(Gln) amidotransferase subunit GatB [Metamycoplasma hominis]|uniref:Asp-tRNA(Asn)/Glu-tRNA(Gln) amidotransferase subunit GatB n=1 Tax=Metamycoplasma hominis TaxID=2098 RepID=UPI003CF3B079